MSEIINKPWGCYQVLNSQEGFLVKKIIVKPLSSWPSNESIEINLNRNIMDFQSNNIDENIQLVYNIELDSDCSITGNLYNSRKDKIYNIYIYEWPIDISKNPQLIKIKFFNVH